MTQKENLLHYGLLSKYRTPLMGVAILFILFCHLDVSQSHHSVEHTHLAGILQTGSVGVDIFLFLSGIGLYYSYAKNKRPYWSFEKKRLLRILPYYLILGGMTYLLYDLVIKQFSFRIFLENLFFISWFSKNDTRYWYVLAIIVFYLLFPVLYSFIHGKRHALLKIVLLSAVWFVVIETLSLTVDAIRTFRIALERLPIFMLGIYMGKPAYENRGIRKTSLALFILLGFILLAMQKRLLPGDWSSYLHYPIRGALAVSIITTVILILELLEKHAPRISGAVISVLAWLGGLTYELYLLHQSFLILFDYPYQPLYYLLVAFVLPTITAAGIFLTRKAWKKRRPA